MSTHWGPPSKSAHRDPPIDRNLLLNPRERFLQHKNRHYAHVSHVPLTYVSLSDRWRRRTDDELRGDEGVLAVLRRACRTARAQGLREHDHQRHLRRGGVDHPA